MKTRLLDRLDRPFYRQLLVLAAPIMLQNFIASSLNMFDTLMIGQLGENEVAAVGVANQVFFLFNLVANGAAAGCSIFLSQFWGGGDRRSVHKVVGLGLLMNLFRVPFLQLIMLLPLGYCFFRMFSRNIQARYAENEKFMRWWRPVSNRIRGAQGRFADRKTHCYFKCPECGQRLRVPKGKGKIMITCPHCHIKFDRKT